MRVKVLSIVHVGPPRGTRTSIDEGKVSGKDAAFCPVRPTLHLSVFCRHIADKRIGTRGYLTVNGSIKQAQKPDLRALDATSWYEAAYYASYF